MFEKLNVSIDLEKALNLQGPVIQSWEEEDGSFTEYHINDVNKLLELLQCKIKFGIYPDIYNITDISGRGASYYHTDAWPTSINFYLFVSGGETTIFYERLPGSPPGVLHDGPTMYDSDQLTFIDEFSAETGDCYLIASDKIHAVTKGINTHRKILKLIWLQHDFFTIRKNLKIFV